MLSCVVMAWESSLSGESPQTYKVVHLKGCVGAYSSQEGIWKCGLFCTFSECNEKARHGTSIKMQLISYILDSE